MNKECVIHWFRQDLRLNDNLALCMASNAGNILPIYIYDESIDKKTGKASKVWLYHSLNALNLSLDRNLSVYLSSNPIEILNKLIKEYSVTKIFWNRCYEPWQVERDTAIKKELSLQGIDVQTFNSFLLYEPWEVLKKDGKPYQVFTPFYKNGYLKAPQPRQPIDIGTVCTIKDIHNHTKINDLKLLPMHSWHASMIKNCKIGEEKAKLALFDFVDNCLHNYAKTRDLPFMQATSKLSASLHFGEISPNTIWHELNNHRDSDDKSKFLSELVWREFSYTQLFYFNDLPTKNFKTKFDKFPWKYNDDLFKAWKNGKTGIPIVDAGMRELWQTGTMHNRIRMICASFLTKNCLIDWRKGAKWFLDCLVDADLASNSASWQWVSGSGADSAPYFRIFNPVVQSIKFDPDGLYIKKFVPEISSLPKKYIHEPWKASTETLENLGIKLGVTYPVAIVDLSSSRKEALAAYNSIR